MSEKATFRVEVESPYGNQPIEQFKHWLLKVSDESLERWGINISLTEVTDNDEAATKDDFESQ